MTPASWQEGPHNRWAFQHVDEIVSCAVVSRGAGPTLPLEDAPADLADLRLGGVSCAETLEEFLVATFTDGFLVLKSGQIVCERYFNGMRADSRHLLQSVSKSLCGTLVGELVESGVIDLGAYVATYVPELCESAFGEATVSQLLDMTASVQYDEEYADPDSEVQAHDRAAGWRPRRIEDPPDSYGFLRSLRRAGEHGRVFQYCSATTDALAWVLERATGRRYPDLLSEHLWSRIGAEHDAFVTVDTAGFASANGGVCVALRDLGRFGHLVLRGGSSGEHRVASTEWVDHIRTGGSASLLRGTEFGASYPNGRYSAQWWNTGTKRGTLYASGIYGQLLWLDPAADVVIAKLSSLPEALDPAVTRDHHAAFGGIAAALD